MGPNSSGHSMVDGPTQVSDLDKTELHREFVSNFLDSVLIERQLDALKQFVSEAYVEHNPYLSDGISALRELLTRRDADSKLTIRYEKAHRILAEGNFVLSVCEGYREGKHVSFYDLFRVKDSRIVEHWDTIEKVASRSEWKNDNGKF
jgi:predicted SnoaL-like aldol condensation-catalyzing enzyme